MAERTVAGSERYRSRSALEAVGGGVARALGEGPLRRALRAAYHRLLALRTGGRGLASTLPGGEVVRILPEYRFVTWNPLEYAAFREAVSPGGVALDVGANVGAYTLLLGRWVGPEGRVYAFEPSPGAFEGLRRHLALNALEGVVTPVRAAVSDAVGSAVLEGSGFSGSNRLLPGGAIPVDGGLSVATTTLDEFCAERGIVPSFIKVDVEGAELAALRGARETIRAAGPRLALFVEMHPAVWAETGSSRREIEAELAAQGLRALPLRPTPDPWALEGECLRVVRS